MDSALSLLAVNVGTPRIIGYRHGEAVMSGIAKTMSAAECLFVGRTNIEGDGQADLSVHGGPDKAVYAYSAEHWAWWEGEQGLPCRTGGFGENLTLRGADENDIAIGDRFVWGEALLEVSQPRAPCFKLAMFRARDDLPQLMILSARCGWYLRVIEEGHAPTAGAVFRRVARSGGPSVGATFRALFDPAFPLAERTKVHDAPALSEAWRDSLKKRGIGSRP